MRCWPRPACEALRALRRQRPRSARACRALTGWLRGSGPTELAIREHDWQFALDIATGHKTGFYLDQRDSRQRFAELARSGASRRVLNCFCYTGGFTVAALAGQGGGRVEGGAVSIDSSRPALERARAHVALNGFEGARTEFLDADVNATLRRFVEEGRSFDAIVLDPPKFAPDRGACRARRARLQGHQPAGVQAAGAGRRAAHLLVLGRHRRRPVPQDRGLAPASTPASTATSPSAWARRRTTR